MDNLSIKVARPGPSPKLKKRHHVSRSRMSPHKRFSEAEVPDTSGSSRRFCGKIGARNSGLDLT